MRLLIALLVFVCGAVAGHWLMINEIPEIATDRTLARLQAASPLDDNVLKVGQPRTHEHPVPQSNADVQAIFAILNLSRGPLLLEAPIPPDPVYWSVAIFNHDTVVAGVVSDRDVPRGEPARVFLQGPRSQGEAPAGWASIRTSSDKAILVVRATLRDRNDAAEVAAMTEVLNRATLTPFLP